MNARRSEISGKSSITLLAPGIFFFFLFILWLCVCANACIHVRCCLCLRSRSASAAMRVSRAHFAYLLAGLSVSPLGGLVLLLNRVAGSPQVSAAPFQKQSSWLEVNEATVRDRS